MNRVSAPARLILAAVILYALIRVQPTAAAMKDLFFGCVYFLGGVVSVALAFSIAERTVLSIAESWNRQVFDACGILHPNGLPCHLPHGHRDTEHATAWSSESEGSSVEVRYRFDATGDREERRRIREVMPKVTRSGDPETATAGKS